MRGSGQSTRSQSNQAVKQRFVETSNTFRIFVCRLGFLHARRRGTGWKCEEDKGGIRKGYVLVNITVQQPLSNVQAEFLKLFSARIPDSQLLELQKVMDKLLLEPVKDIDDKIWDAEGYSVEWKKNKIGAR